MTVSCARLVALAVLGQGCVLGDDLHPPTLDLDPMDDLEDQSPGMPDGMTDSEVDPAYLATAGPGILDPIDGGAAVALRPGPGLLVYHLFDKQIAYRTDHYAVAQFDVPECNGVQNAFARVTAYNDDATYSRAVWFALDGEGGYLGTTGVGMHSVSGIGVLSPKETQKWAYDLSQVDIGHTLSEGEGPGGNASFLDMLKQPGRHDVESWVSTYSEYGPGSWVSLELFLLR
jgi:hypothetical protein